MASGEQVNAPREIRKVDLEIKMFPRETFLEISHHRGDLEIQIFPRETIFDIINCNDDL